MGLGSIGLELGLLKSDALDSALVSADKLDIVVCEPSGVQRNIISQSMKETGCDVHAVENAGQALALIRGGIRDILITSFELPDMSEMELCWRMKSTSDLAHVQTIVLSAHDDQRRIAEALDSGADDFIRKPIQTLEMRARIRAASRIVRLQKRLYDDANKDALTGVSNRRCFIQLLDDQLRKGEQLAAPVCVVILDLDRFKSINDTHGHAAGDEVLKEVAHRTEAMLSEDEAFGRLGGEEFALLFYGRTLEQSRQRANDFRAVLANTAIAVSGDVKLNVTASFGVACSFDQTLATDQDCLFSRADAALYQAKTNGRNQVQVARPDIALKSAL